MRLYGCVVVTLVMVWFVVLAEWEDGEGNGNNINYKVRILTNAGSIVSTLVSEVTRKTCGQT